MIYLLDSNILIYARMNGMPEHLLASSWLSETLADRGVSVLVTETSILSFLRITTSIKAFNPPLSFDKAASFLSRFLKQTAVTLYNPSGDHFIEVADFMKAHNFAGNLAMDAHLAVVALNTGATLVTRDGDFARIQYLKLLNPLGSYSDE